MAQDPADVPPATPTVPAAARRRLHVPVVVADLAVVAVLTVAVFLFAIRFELSERLDQWTLRYEPWQIDELPAALMTLFAGLMWFSWRRTRQAQRAMRERIAAEERVVALLLSNHNLARQLILVQENERRSLARELHDEVGQDCTAIRADATYILRARPDDSAGIAASAQRIAATSERLYALVKRMLRQLRPMTLDSLGLVPALQELCEHWEEQTGVSCGFFPFAVPDDLDDPTCITLFRLVQEGLTNVGRHANASQVRVELRRGDPDRQLILRIEDDGCGLPAGGDRQTGFGLTGMRERVAGLQGQLRISSSPGQGVRIEAVLPMMEASV
jgi:signal transduction histidine kinase